MANGRKISQFQSAASVNLSDVVGGVQGQGNVKFSFATILAWLKTTLSPSDIGAIPSAEKGAADGVATLDANGKVPGTQLDLSGKQDKITASGILKGDGAGGVSAAVAGTDYGTYSKPSGGIPSSDMTSAVQTSLGKADSAYQKPSGGIPASDLANGVIPSVPSPSDSTPQALGTAAAGSSGNYSRADHVHQKPSASDVGAIPTSEKGANGGVATLGSDGKVPSAQLPPISAEGKADESTIAPTESSTTATVAHPLGSVFYLSGVLYRALADIAIGGTINTGAGGNATQTTVAQNFKRTVTLTSAQYSQLSAAEKAADIVYIVTDEPVPEISTSTPNMDGTGAAGSTGEVSDAGHTHPSDTTKANETELAYVETGTTASRAYAVGEYFCWNGLLYRAKTAISSGGTFTPGTNCEQATVATELYSPQKVTLYSTITDVSSDTTISIGYNIERFNLLCIVINTASTNPSSTRGTCIVPLITLRASTYYPTIINGVSGYLRIGTNTDGTAIRVISTSFTSLYVVAIYGMT